MGMKAWHFVFLHDFQESNTWETEFKYQLLLIAVAPQISFSSLEELFSKATYFSHT